MNLQEFDLSGLLQFKPEEGRLLLKQDRMLMFRQEAFRFLQRVLSEQLGTEVTHALLSQFGYRCGHGDFAVLSSGFDWDSEADALGCGPLMHCWEGIVAVEPVHMDFDHETGHFDFCGVWRNSYEAEIYLENFGKADHPVCSSLTGYASGWCSAFFGQELLAVEHKCLGQGDPHCEWQIRPINVWNEKANYWKEALKATNLSIAQDLERQVNERTREVHSMMLQMQEKNKALLQLDHLKSRFLANVSHEVRTPLTLILGPLQNLMREAKTMDLPETALEDLDLMNRNAARLFRLVSQLLDYSKLEAGQMETHRESVDLSRLVKELVEEGQGQARAKNIDLSFNSDLPLKKLSLDRDQVEKIVINLLGNALKFTPISGKVTVEVSQQGKDAIIAVTDTGPGIARENQSRIFERFQQVDNSSTRKHQGTGIGLALVQEFCELHGGSISVESLLGKGSRFLVRLPIHQAPEGPTEMPAQQNLDLPHFLTPMTRKQYPQEDHLPTIVIADDNSDLRNYMARLLTNRFKVLVAENGIQAHQLILQHAPKVVLSDVMMPEMDGIGLVSLLKNSPETSHIPVILVTARAGAEASVDGLASGADDYIVKPFTDAELLARVDAAVRMRDLYDKLAIQNERLKKEMAHREKMEGERDHFQQQLILASREAGRAEVATSILHNAGNVLNSVGISVSSLLSDDVEKPLPLLLKIVDLLNKHREDPVTFFATKKGPAVLDALSLVAESFQDNNTLLEDELRRVADQVEHLSIIVSEQNAFARTSNVMEETEVNSLVRHAIGLNTLTLNSRALKIIENYHETLPTLILDRHKVLQILFNLLKNAMESFVGCSHNAEAGDPKIEKWIRITTDLTECDQEEMVCIKVQDNGMGITTENLKNIFRSGFSTKPRGNGFGLHSSANLAREMGGRLQVESEGLARGATFSLLLPLTPPARD